MGTNIYVEATTASLADALRTVASMVEELEVKDDESLDLETLAQSLRDAQGEASSLSEAIANLTDCSVSDIVGEINEVESAADSLASTLDDLASEVENAS